MDRKVFQKRVHNFRLFRRYILRRLVKPGHKGKSTIVFIVTFPRSGSTALGSLFDSIGQPFIYYGEIFGFNQWPKAIDRITANYPFFSSRYLKFFLLKKKEGTIPYKFEASGIKAEKVLRSLQRSPGIHVFKIMSFHFHPEKLEALMERYQPKVLFLRRNHLDRFISTKKAQATGKWHGFNTDEDIIDIDEESLNHSIKQSVAFYDDIHQFCASHQIDWMDLDYSEVFSQESLKEILEFMEGEPRETDFISLIKTKRQDNKHLTRENFLQDLASQKPNASLADYDFIKHDY